MNDPFVRRYWTGNPAAAGAASPRHYQPQPMPKHPLQPPAPAGPRRVVSIPVADGSEKKQRPIRVTGPTVEAEAEAARSSAAVKIQSAARGFLVRKGVRVVRRLEAEVEEIERRTRSSLDLLLGNERERLRVSEMLMSALFKLDGVRGVRDYRRRVIRKAISLQEALDSISGEGGAVPRAAECDHAGGASTEEESAVTVNGAGAADREAGGAMEVATGRATGEDVGSLESPQRESASATEEPGTAAALEETLEAPDSLERTNDAEAEDLMMNSFVMVDSQAGHVDVSAAAIPSEKSEGEKELEEEGASGMEIGSPDMGPEPAEGEKRMEEAMEKMVMDNAKLRGMVAELLERTAAQSRLVCGLSRRIEDLERKVEKMGRKKRKQHAGAAAKAEADRKGDNGGHRLP